MTDIAIRLNRIAGAADEIERAAYDIIRQRDTLIAVSANLPDLGGSDEILAAHLRKQAGTLVRSGDLIGKMAICLRMIANLYMQTDQKSAANKPSSNKGLIWTPVPVYPGKPVTLRWINHGSNNNEPEIGYLVSHVKHPPKPKVMRFVTVKPQRLVSYTPIWASARLHYRNIPKSKFYEDAFRPIIGVNLGDTLGRNGRV